MESADELNSDTVEAQNHRQEPTDVNTIQWGTAKGDSREEAAVLMRLRLLNPASAVTATMALRPQLLVRTSLAPRFQTPVSNY